MKQGEIERREGWRRGRDREGGREREEGGRDRESGRYAGSEGR